MDLGESDKESDRDRTIKVTKGIKRGDVVTAGEETKGIGGM